MEYLRDFNFVSVLVRMLLALVCGGLIGIERETKSKAAGLRTHILVCVGAAMTTLISQYIVLELNMYTDLARLGAQVIAGMGFISAGVIVVKRERRVKGLTTAAGLWVNAIIGLCCGATFYEGAISTTVVVLLCQWVLSKWEAGSEKELRNAKFTVRYTSIRALNLVLSYAQDMDMTVLNLDIIDGNSEVMTAELDIRLHRKVSRSEFIADVYKFEGIVSVSEIAE